MAMLAARLAAAKSQGKHKKHEHEKKWKSAERFLAEFQEETKELDLNENGNGESPMHLFQVERRSVRGW